MRGVGVGLAAAVKLTPLLFVAYLLVTRRFRAAATAVGVFVVTGAAGFLAAPADSVQFRLRGTFAPAGRISDVAGPSNTALAGFLARAGLPELVAGGAYLVVFLAVLGFAARSLGRPVPSDGPETRKAPPG